MVDLGVSLALSIGSEDACLDLASDMLPGSSLEYNKTIVLMRCTRGLMVSYT